MREKVETDQIIWEGRFKASLLGAYDEFERAKSAAQERGQDALAQYNYYAAERSLLEAILETWDEEIYHKQAKEYAEAQGNPTQIQAKIDELEVVIEESAGQVVTQL